VEPTFEQLGLPGDRAFVSMDPGGTRPPGAERDDLRLAWRDARLTAAFTVEA
jgi:hypothetical protein